MIKVAPIIDIKIENNLLTRKRAILRSQLLYIIKIKETQFAAP